MSAATERALSDAADPVEERALGDMPIDVSETPTPETFNVDEWIAGVRPTRRSVRIFARGDLIAAMEVIADRIREADDDADVDDLIDRFEALKAEFQSGLTVTVEKRSSDWERKFRKDFIRDAKLSVKMRRDDSNDMDGPADERGRVVLHQLAAQIVSPTFTYEQLTALEDANEGELAKLLRALNEVNRTVAEAQDVMTADFSRRRSGNRERPGS